MKYGRRVLSFVLSLLILCTSCAVAVSAAQSEVRTQAKSSQSDAIRAYFETLAEYIRQIINLFKSLFGIKSPTYLDGISVVSEKTAEGSAESVKIQCKNFEYSLYLPANIRKDAVVFKFDSEKNVSVNGKKISSGEVTDVLSGLDKFNLNFNGKRYSIKLYQSENIPAVYIETESGTMSSVNADKTVKESGYAAIVNTDGSSVYDGKLDYIKGRGNSSWKYAKRGYNFKLDKSTNICGMGKNKKWSLIPNHIDKSLLRNEIVYDLAGAIGLEYSPKNQPVDLYLNGQYNGTYLLVVKNEISKASVNIDDLEKATEKVNSAELDTYSRASVSNQNNVKNYKYVNIPNNPADITGGYYLEFDQSGYKDEISGFTTLRNQSIVVKSPEYASKAQVEYISAWFQEFEDAVYSETGYNSLNKHYTDYIDIESFAKYYLLTEFAMNGDSHITSVFMYKESDITGDGLLHAGSVWDYDSSLGNNGGVKHFDVNVTLANPNQQFYSISKIFQTNTDFIYAALYKHSQFRSLCADLYKKDVVPAIKVLLSKNDNTYNGLHNYNYYVNQIKPSAAMNFKRYPIMANSMTGIQTGVTFDENTEQLYKFMNNRKAFMDQTIDAYYEDYDYIFVKSGSVYGVTSFADKTVELYKGDSSVLNTKVDYAGVTFTVTSVR